MQLKDVIIIVLIIIAIATRFFFLIDGMSILPNFTAIGAMAILAAVYLKGSKKIIYPLFGLWLSDLVLNNLIYGQYFDHFQVFGEISVYCSIALIGLLAVKLMKKPSWINLAFTCIGGAVLFFLITNFGVWLKSTSPYTKDISGLLSCYEAGIPFFRNTIISNLFYGFAFFGIYETLASRISSIEPLLGKKPYIG